MAVKDYHFDLDKLRETAYTREGFYSIKLSPDLRQWLIERLGHMDRIGYIRGTMQSGWSIVEHGFLKGPTLMFRAEDNVAMLFKLTWV